MLIAIVVSAFLTVMTLVLTLITISRGYSYTHTIDPLNEGDEVRKFTGNGKRL